VLVVISPVSVNFIMLGTYTEEWGGVFCEVPSLQQNITTHTKKSGQKRQIVSSHVQ